MLYGQAVESRQWKVAENVQPGANLAEDFAKKCPGFVFAAFKGGGIGKAPMRDDRLARPNRADFAGGRIANRDDEIHFRRAGASKLVPAFRAQILRRQA